VRIPGIILKGHYYWEVEIFMLAFCQWRDYLSVLLTIRLVIFVKIVSHYGNLKTVTEIGLLLFQFPSVLHGTTPIGLKWALIFCDFAWKEDSLLSIFHPFNSWQPFQVTLKFI
jgi:hypothetical protein